MTGSLCQGVVDGLTALGRNARWALAIGAVAALFTGPISGALRPLLPVFLVVLYGLAFMRIDPVAVLRDALRPAAAIRNLAICAAMMIAAPVILFAAAMALTASPEIVSSLVYLGVSPSIASAAALAFFMRADAALALQVTVLSGFLAPLLGPLIATALLGAAAPVDAATLSLRLGAILGVAITLALILRRALTPQRIDRHAGVMDGLASLTLILFLIPLFDGVGAQILAAPTLALGVLALVSIANVGFQVISAHLAKRWLDNPQASALGVLMGNRNVSLYVAALPPDPFFTLFVALYQYPMYLTPLVVRRMLPGA